MFFWLTFRPGNYFGSFHIGFWLLWEISGFWDRGSTQNFEPDLSSRVILPGELFWKKCWFSCDTQQITCPCLEIFGKWSLFPKLLPKPNHYARSIRLEILCRTPVSKSWYLLYESNSNLKTPNRVPWPECQPEVLGGVTKHTIIKSASVTYYKIYFGSASSTPHKKPSCEVNLLICVRGWVANLLLWYIGIL